MGNMSSADESERHSRGISSRREPRSSHRHRARSQASSAVCDDDSDWEDDGDWEVINRSAPQQMPSQEYYPVPWTHQTGGRPGEAGIQVSTVLASGARPRETNWQQIGEMAVGAAAWVDARCKAHAERQRTALEEDPATFPAPSAPPLPSTPPPPQCVPLPEVCRRHPGCTDGGCRQLHLCIHFLADLCHFGDRCRRGHSLTTVHNQLVCNMHGLDTGREQECLLKLSRACEENGRLPESIYYENLKICFWAACNEHMCNKLHICRRFVVGECARPVCRFNHDLHSSHNSEVLRRHKMAGIDDNVILDLLRDKYPRLAQQGPPYTGAGSTGGARQLHLGGAAGDDQPTSGLSDELKCPVCLELFDRATTLGCGHTFCAGCVGEVRGAGQRCPLCRVSITSCTRSVALDNIVSNMAAKR